MTTNEFGCDKGKNFLKFVEYKWRIENEKCVYWFIFTNCSLVCQKSKKEREEYKRKEKKRKEKITIIIKEKRKNGSIKNI